MFYDETAAFACQSHPSERPDLLHLNNRPSHLHCVWDFHKVFNWMMPCSHMRNWGKSLQALTEGECRIYNWMIHLKHLSVWPTCTCWSHNSKGGMLVKWWWMVMEWFIRGNAAFLKLCQGAIMLVCDANSLHCCTQVWSILLTWNVAECNTHSTRKSTQVKVHLQIQLKKKKNIEVQKKIINTAIK